MYSLLLTGAADMYYYLEEPAAGLQDILNRYFTLLPQYQGVALEELKFKRVLFGGFPCYEDVPLQPGFDRVLQVCSTWTAHSCQVGVDAGR